MLSTTLQWTFFFGTVMLTALGAVGSVASILSYIDDRKPKRSWRHQLDRIKEFWKLASCVMPTRATRYYMTALEDRHALFLTHAVDGISNTTGHWLCLCFRWRCAAAFGLTLVLWVTSIPVECWREWRRHLAD